MKIVQFRKNIDKSVEEAMQLCEKSGMDVEVRDGKKLLMTIRKDTTLEEPSLPPLKVSFKDAIIQSGISSPRQTKVLTDFFTACQIKVK